MSTISAGTTISTALVSAGDTTGALVFKTGASATTAMTIGADQSVTFAGTVYGLGGGGATSSGSVVLTAASGGAQSITTTNYGQSVTLPDATTLGEGGALYNINNLGAYPLKIVNNAGSTLGFVYPNCPVIAGLADNSTAAGVWSLVGAEPFGPVALTYSTDLSTRTVIRKTVVIDANRTLIIVGNTSLAGIIYDSSTLTWGALTVIRTGTGIDQAEAILSATNQVLVNSSIATAMEAVVLTLSGTVITVNTATAATLSANNSGAITGTNLIAVGSSFVITYTATTPQMRAMTISGTAVTLGAATVLNGTNISTGGANLYLTAVSSSVVLVLSNTAASTFYATPYTISGTTITLGTGATYASTSADTYQVRPISSGVRWAVVIASSTNSVVGLIISVTGTTATISSATLSTGGGAAYADIGTIVSGSKLILVHGNTGGYTNILTDTAGTASAGVQIGPLSAAQSPVPISVNATTSLATFSFGSGSTEIGRVIINFAGSSPVLSAFDSQVGGTGNFVNPTSLRTMGQTYTPNMLIGATSYVWNVTAAGARATGIGENSFYSFSPKFVSLNSTITSITQNKAVAYDPSYGASTTYGALQIVESVS